jgi:hypothetical protein
MLVQDRFEDKFVQSQKSRENPGIRTNFLVYCGKDRRVPVNLAKGG